MLTRTLRKNKNSYRVTIPMNIVDMAGLEDGQEMRFDYSYEKNVIIMTRA